LRSVCSTLLIPQSRTCVTQMQRHVDLGWNQDCKRTLQASVLLCPTPVQLDFMGWTARFRCTLSSLRLTTTSVPKWLLTLSLLFGAEPGSVRSAILRSSLPDLAHTRSGPRRSGCTLQLVTMHAGSENPWNVTGLRTIPNAGRPRAHAAPCKGRAVTSGGRGNCLQHAPRRTALHQALASQGLLRERPWWILPGLQRDTM
jgi:hypothetical protein